VFSLVLGLVILAAQWIGGNPTAGLESLGVMAGFGLLLLAGGRSETIRGLRGDGRDERFALIDLRATAFAGHVIILAVIVGWLVELARGHDGATFGLLGALGGVAYLLAVVVQRVRA
jgi:hypothetical protein